MIKKYLKKFIVQRLKSQYKKPKNWDDMSTYNL